MWIWKNRFLREYEDFTFLSAAFAQDLVRQNIRYAEVFFSPIRFVDEGLQIPRLFEAVRAGLSSAPDVEVALIGDLVRDYGPDRAMTTLKEFEEVKHHGVIGIGIGGSEHKFPPELFTAVYREAREMGFRTTAHAGEAAGPPSVWGAIHELGVERIGHGARSGEDESLLDYLAERQIPLELCPLSNIKTAVFDSIENHPVRRLYDRGVLLTINTDDPMMFGNSLVDDYAALVEVHGFTRDDVKTLILNAVKASWLSDERKEQLVQEFSAELE
jgi:adenosine deaminase